MQNYHANNRRHGNKTHVKQEVGSFIFLLKYNTVKKYSIRVLNKYSIGKTVYIQV